MFVAKAPQSTRIWTEKSAKCFLTFERAHHIEVSLLQVSILDFSRYKGCVIVVPTMDEDPGWIDWIKTGTGQTQSVGADILSCCGIRLCEEPKFDVTSSIKRRIYSKMC